VGVASVDESNSGPLKVSSGSLLVLGGRDNGGLQQVQLSTSANVKDEPLVLDVLPRFQQQRGGIWPPPQQPIDVSGGDITSVQTAGVLYCDSFSSSCISTGVVNSYQVVPTAVIDALCMNIIPAVGEVTIGHHEEVLTDLGLNPTALSNYKSSGLAKAGISKYYVMTADVFGSTSSQDVISEVQKSIGEVDGQGLLKISGVLGVIQAGMNTDQATASASGDPAALNESQRIVQDADDESFAAEPQKKRKASLPDGEERLDLLMEIINDGPSSRGTAMLVSSSSAVLGLDEGGGVKQQNATADAMRWNGLMSSDVLGTGGNELRSTMAGEKTLQSDMSHVDFTLQSNSVSNELAGGHSIESGYPPFASSSVLPTDSGHSFSPPGSSLDVLQQIHRDDPMLFSFSADLLHTPFLLTNQSTAGHDSLGTSTTFTGGQEKMRCSPSELTEGQQRAGEPGLDTDYSSTSSLFSSNVGLPQIQSHQRLQNIVQQQQQTNHQSQHNSRQGSVEESNPPMREDYVGLPPPFDAYSANPGYCNPLCVQSDYSGKRCADDGAAAAGFGVNQGTGRGEHILGFVDDIGGLTPGFADPAMLTRMSEDTPQSHRSLYLSDIGHQQRAPSGSLGGHLSSPSGNMHAHSAHESSPLSMHLHLVQHGVHESSPLSVQTYLNSGSCATPTGSVKSEIRGIAVEDGGMGTNLQQSLFELETLRQKVGGGTVGSTSVKSPTGASQRTISDEAGSSVDNASFLIDQSSLQSFNSAQYQDSSMNSSHVGDFPYPTSHQSHIQPVGGLQSKEWPSGDPSVNNSLAGGNVGAGDAGRYDRTDSKVSSMSNEEISVAFSRLSDSSQVEMLNTLLQTANETVPNG